MKPQLLLPKRYYLLILSFGILSICEAQIYPLITEGKIWSNLVDEYRADTIPLIATHFIKTLEVQITSYEENYRICELQRSDKEDMSDWYDYGTLIEDGQMVFYQKSNGYLELLYDFGAVKGDSFYVYDGPKIRFYTYPEKVFLRVDSVDTISIQGIARKRIMLEGHNAYGHSVEETWISGIGSLSGILFNGSFAVGYDGSYLRCLNQGDTLLYKYPYAEDCFYSNHVGMIGTYGISEKIEIFPNPTADLITIESDKADRIEILITSLNGQLILSREMEGTTHQLDLSSFEKGVYFITIRSQDFVTTRKIIKL